MSSLAFIWNRWLDEMNGAPGTTVPRGGIVQRMPQEEDDDTPGITPGGSRPTGIRPRSLRRVAKKHAKVTKRLLKKSAAVQARNVKRTARATGGDRGAAKAHGQAIKQRAKTRSQRVSARPMFSAPR